MGVAAAMAPVSALGTVTNSATCTGTMTLSFTTPLTAFPAARSLTLSGSGTCIGPGAGAVSWATTATATSIDATCAGIAVLASGTMTLPSGLTPVTIIGAGPSAAQSWTFLDNSGMNALTATGVFAWTNTAEIQNCALAGTSTMTLTGAFVVVA